MERLQVRPASHIDNAGNVVAAVKALGRETVGLIVLGLRISRGGSR